MSETKLIDIRELKFDEHNFNKHNDEGMSLLEKSIKENGFGRSVLLDKDNNIVGGNGVTEQAIKAGASKVRIIETDGTELIAVKRTDLTLDSEAGRILGISKVARVVGYCSARLQLQERLAKDIVKMLSDALNNDVQGMAIVMKGTHLCKTMRGVKSRGQMTVAHLSGIFKENTDARREFYKLIDAN